LVGFCWFWVEKDAVVVYCFIHLFSSML